MNRQIIIKTWDSGDWVEVFVDGVEVVQGHSLSTQEVAQLLRYLGHEVQRQSVVED